jgi:predicted transcriptional regulator
MPKDNNFIFDGFDKPEANYFKLPNNWTDITARLTSLAEVKLVEYVLKHTWGYQEFGLSKKITTDEFMNGRKNKTGERLDLGTGLSNRSIIDGLNLAVKHGLLEIEIDDRDRARVKKYYRLKMKVRADDTYHDASDEYDDNHADVKNLHIGMQNLHSRGVESSHRTEKDTLERYNFEKKNNKRKGFNGDTTEESASIGHILAHNSSKYFKTSLTQSNQALQVFIEDISAEFGDSKHLWSNLTQARNLMAESGLAEPSFIQRAYEAAALTRESVQLGADNGRPVQNRMAYFFRTLKHSLGLD